MENDSTNNEIIINKEANITMQKLYKIATYNIINKYLQCDKNE